jgi:hypothetical protein
VSTGRTILTTTTLAARRFWSLPWFLKTSVLPEFFRYLKQFASPGIIGKLPQGDEVAHKVDSAGNLMYEDEAKTRPKFESSATQLLSSLVAWVNAVAIVVKNGTEIDFLKSDGDGDAYKVGLEYFGKQITEAILGTSQATKEAQHESRSSKQTAQDLLSMRVAHYRREIGEVLTRDLVRLIVNVRHGAEAADFAPTLHISRVEQQDWAERTKVFIDGVAKGFFFRSQLPWIFSQIGVPQPDWAAEDAALQEAIDQRMLAQQEASRILNPASTQ